MSTTLGGPPQAATPAPPSWVRNLDSIPTLPVVASRLIEMALSDSATANDLGELISKDPGLTAKLLKVVNSASYGMRSEVTSMSHAISIIGRQALRSLVLGISVFETFKETSGGETNYREALWRHAVASAAAGQVIAEGVGKVNVEEAYIAGLMHDIGKVALELLRPHEYRKALAEAASSPNEDERACEQRICGLDHVALGDLIAERWSLPSGIRAAIHYHHDPGSAAGEPTPIRRIVAIAKAADAVAYRCGYAASDAAHPQLGDKVTAELLSRLNQDSVVQRVKDEVRKSAEVFRYDGVPDPEVWQRRLYAANAELSRAFTSLGDNHRTQQRCMEVILRSQGFLGSKDTMEGTLREIVQRLGFDRAQFFELAGDGRSIIVRKVATADGRGSKLEGTSVPVEDPAILPKDRPVVATATQGRAQDRWLSHFGVPALVLSAIPEEGRVRYVLATDRGPKVSAVAEAMAGDVLAHEILAPSLALLFQNDRLYRRAQYLSVTDVLTGVSNRRALMDALEGIEAAATQSQASFCVAMADIDHFKKFNDECGHQAGDQVLRAVAQAIRGSCRSEDVVGRYGGEEFCIVMPGTELEAARGVAARVRQAVELAGAANAARFAGLSITISIGLAAFQIGKEHREACLARADAALYQAKKNGRNRVEDAPGG